VTAADTWSLPPRVIELDQDEVHVWMVRSGATEGRDQKLAALLSAEERERAAKFKFDKDRRLYIGAHAWLRFLLSAYLRVSAKQIHFTLGAHGKPQLAQPAASGFEFNLSHSHELALVAVAQRRAVGVDVEFVKSDFASAQVAGRFFTAKEAAALVKLPEALRREAFFKCWSSKEAFLKAKATGLSGQLDEVEIISTGDGLVAIEANVSGWSLLELPLIDGYAAALAVAGGSLPMRCYRWDPARID
jgi:4'-phosphopantetheinyl transferase